MSKRVGEAARLAGADQVSAIRRTEANSIFHLAILPPFRLSPRVSSLWGSSDDDKFDLRRFGIRPVAVLRLSAGMGRIEAFRGACADADNSVSEECCENEQVVRLIDF